MKKRWVCLLVVLAAAGEVRGQEPVDLGEIVITASRMAQFDDQVSSDVSVITGEDILSSPATTLSDVVGEAVGVRLLEYGSEKSSSVDIRGFGDTASRNVLVLVNDRRVNAIDISAPDLLQIPLGSIERVEVIRGASSVLYGDNAVGGVINIITKKGRGPLSGHVKALAGSYDTSGTDAEVSGSVRDLSYYLYAQYLDKHGHRSNSHLQAKDGNARLAYQATGLLGIDLNMGWHEDDYGLPGGLSQAEIETLGRSGSADEDDFAATKDRFVDLGLEFLPGEEDGSRGRLFLNVHHRNRDVYDSFNSFGEFSTKRDIATSGLTAKYVFDHEVMGREVNLVTGMDYYDHENTILGSGLNTDDLTISKGEFGGYGYFQLETLKDLHLNGGARYHRADYAFSQRNTPVDEKRKADAVVWMGGLKYDFTEQSHVYYSVQKTFRFLATDEWYSSAYAPSFGITPGLNTGLHHQTGIQYELGIKHRLNRRSEVTLTGYRIDNNDEIFYDPVAFGNSNYDRTRRTGVEFGLRHDLRPLFSLQGLDRLEFWANYAYQRARFDGGAYDGKTIPLVPEHQSVQGLQAGFGGCARVSVSGRYVAPSYAVNDVGNSTPRIKAYYILDGKMTYDHGPLEVSFSLNNITNKLYSPLAVQSAFSSARDYFPAVGRNFLIEVGVKF